MMKRGVSVVIPTYNSRLFLEEGLQSIFDQTLKPLEIIVADDCSTDGTPEMIESIAAAAPLPVRLIRSPRNSGGPARPLNQGIASASGEIIATLDHDDSMHQRRIERQVESLGKWSGLGLSLVRCEAPGGVGRFADIDTWQRRILERLRCDHSDGPFYRLNRESSCDALVSSCFPLSCSNMMFPKFVWSNLGGFDESFILSSDYDFSYKVASYYDIIYVDEVLTTWVPRSDSHFRSASRLDQLREAIRIIESIKDSSLSISGRRARKLRLREESLNAAFLGREVGDYRSAAVSYIKSMRFGGFSLEAAFGLIKLAPHWSRRLAFGAVSSTAMANRSHATRQ